MSTPLLKAITVHQQRVALAKQGYALVKVRTATKEAFEPKWQQPSHARNVQQWEADQTADDALNTGLLTNGMRAIDIDIDDPHLAEFVVQQCRLLFGWGPKRSRAGSGRCMLFYRAENARPKPVMLMGIHGKVEARGNGQQAVIYGIHPESGMLYEWDTELTTIPQESLPVVSDEQVQELFNAIYQQIGAFSPASKLSEVRSPVATMPEPSATPTVTKRDAANARAVLANECKSLSAMQPGSHRNNALNEASFTVGTVLVWLDPREAAQALYQASVENGYVAKRGTEAAQQTIMSGLNAGALKPRAPLPEDDASDRIDITNLTIGGKHIDEVLASLGVGAVPLRSERLWPAPMGDAAYIGIIGEYVRLVEPHTEGDAAALLVAILTVLGSAFGRNAWLVVGASKHHPNLFSVIVAETSKGRKGTVMAEAKRFARMVDVSMESRMVSGLSSGEGLIEHVRDAREEDVPVKEGGKVTGHQRQVVDKGVADKRLLVTEGEMGQALTVASREGNTLSATLRLAWDSETLQTLARSNKNVCKEPHIAIFGNITVEELQRLLTATDRANGFANRFLWVCARRSKELPWGGNVGFEALQGLAFRTTDRIVTARNFGQCGWMPDAAELWQGVYSRLSAGKSGLAGAMSARAEAQTIRIALIYALLDGSNNIAASHLQAALEVWRYCEESTEYIFGSSLGDSTADEIIRMLTSKPEGATMTEINSHFGRNKSSDELRRALVVLQHASKVRSEKRNTGGRPSEIWLRA